MYLVGSPHPNRDRALELVRQLAQQQELLVPSVEVYQEILHRYTAIQRWEAIDTAFRALDSIVDEVVPLDIGDIRTARTLVGSVAFCWVDVPFSEGLLTFVAGGGKNDQ